MSGWRGTALRAHRRSGGQNETHQNKSQRKTFSRPTFWRKRREENPSDLSIDDGRERQVVEYLGAVSPHRHRAVLAEALIVEAIDLCDLPGLVVSPDQSDPVWITHLRNQKQEDLCQRPAQVQHGRA